MLEGLDLIGLGMVCLTVLGAFLLHGSFQAEVDELAEDLAGLEQAHSKLVEECTQLKTQVTDLTATVAGNAATLGRVVQKVTGEALAVMGGRPRG